VQFRLPWNLLANMTTVWQSDDHYLTFCFQRFEFTAFGSPSIELHVMSAYTVNVLQNYFCRIVREVKVASEPDAQLAVLKNATYRFRRIAIPAPKS
jgi:hypothetical protein